MTSPLEERVSRLSATDRKVFEAFRGLGLDPGAALIAAEGRDGPGQPARDPFDELVEGFRSLGLSESAARVAAAGGETESEARRGWAETQPSRRRTDVERERIEDEARRVGARGVVEATRFAKLVDEVQETNGLSLDDALYATVRLLAEEARRRDPRVRQLRLSEADDRRRARGRRR